MLPSGEFEAELARVQRRYRIVIALMAFGACVLVAVVLAGALAALDHRVADSYFRNDPGRSRGKGEAISSARASTSSIAAATVNGGANSPVSSPPGPPQAITGDNGQAPETTLDSQRDDVRTHTRHRRRHHRR